MTYLGATGDTSEVSEHELNKGGGQYPDLPAGWYQVALLSDKVDQKSWGLGLSLQFQVDEGDFESERVSDYLCIVHNTSSEAQHIARVRLRELANAAGHPTPENVEDTEPLMGVPLMARIYRPRAKDPKYAAADGTETRVGEYLSIGEWNARYGRKSEPTRQADVPTNSPGAQRAALPTDAEIPF